MSHHSPNMDFTHINYVETFQNCNLNSFHNSIKICTHSITCFHQMKVSLKVTNTHLYTNQKETKHFIFLSLHITWLPSQILHT